MADRDRHRQRHRQRAEAALVVGALLRAVWPAAAAGLAVAAAGAAPPAARAVALLTYAVAVTVPLRHGFVRRWFGRR